MPASIRCGCARNARELEHLIGHERIDIVHAYDAGAAWSARIAASQIAVLAGHHAAGRAAPTPACAAAMPARWRRAIASSRRRTMPPRRSWSASACAPSRSPSCRASSTPRPIDPAAVSTERVDALRNAGASRPTTGSCWCPAASRRGTARSCCPRSRARWSTSGMRDFVVRHRRREHDQRQICARRSQARAGAWTSTTLIRMTGHCADMPAAFAAADFVAVPAIEPPLLGRVVAQAQAMGRPVVTTDVGVLPEHVVAPPRMPEDVRTGWVATPGDPRRLRARAGTRADARTPPPIARCPRARGNSRNTCSRQRALPRRCGRSIRRSWRAISSGWKSSGKRTIGPPLTIGALLVSSQPSAVRHRVHGADRFRIRLRRRSMRSAAASPRRADRSRSLIVTPSLHAGAADAGTVQLVRILAPAGHRPIVVSSGGRLVADVTAAGATFIAMNVATQQSDRRCCATRMALARIVREQRCDVIHAHGARAGLERLLRRAAHRRAVPDQLVQRLPRAEHASSISTTA